MSRSIYPTPGVLWRRKTLDTLPVTDLRDTETPDPGPTQDFGLPLHGVHGNHRRPEWKTLRPSPDPNPVRRSRGDSDGVENVLLVVTGTEEGTTVHEPVTSPLTPSPDRHDISPVHRTGGVSRRQDPDDSETEDFVCGLGPKAIWNFITKSSKSHVVLVNLPNTFVCSDRTRSLKD